VGRNASGKSNFLDALALLRHLMDLRTTEAINAHNGWRAIQCRSANAPDIALEFQSTFESCNSIWESHYSFTLGVTKHNQVVINREDLMLYERGRGRQLGYTFVDGKLNWIGRDQFENDPQWISNEILPRPVGGYSRLDPCVFGPGRHDRLLLSIIGTQPFLDLSDSLRASSVYNFSPQEMRLHQPLTASPILSREGGNLARAIEGLREIEPDTILRIGSYLASIVEDFQGFHTTRYGDYETVRFYLRRQKEKPPLEFDASSMSDGTLRAIAALVAAFQIVIPGGFPGFIGIDEPETSLHPAAMRALVDALDEATLRTQVLLSTHSAEMLDNPTIHPENIRVVQMIDGQTVIAPVDEASVEIVRRNLNTLGGLERQNRLEPNEDDLKRQRQIHPNGSEAQ
jgi:predicted ATPase